jgi:transcriptional regulator with XRE-family HTH domain
MKTKNELFLEAVDYLIDEGLAMNQGDVALKAGLGPNLISRVRNGKVKSVNDDSIRALAAKFNLNMDYFRGKSEYITRYDQASANLDRDLGLSPKMSEPQQTDVPDFIQRLFDESVRMSTRNEMLERQCEQLIAELREAKTDNDTFLEELRKSKEFNDALAAELKISRTQNESLITELRETRKELQTAIDGIETMKNQFSMMVSQYATPQPSAFPMTVNDDGEIKFVIPDVLGHDTKKSKKTKDQQLYALVPQGLIRGGRPGVTEEIVKQAVEAFKKKK